MSERGDHPEQHEHHIGPPIVRGTIRASLTTAERKTYERTVMFLAAIVVVLAATLIVTLALFGRALDNNTASNRRLTVSQEAVNCFSEKQGTFAGGIVDTLAAVRARDDAGTDAAIAALQDVKAQFETCKSTEAK